MGRSKWPPTTVPTRNRSDCERPSQTDVFPACLRAPGGHGLVTEWSRIFQNAPISVNIRRTGEPSRLFFDLHISTPTDTNWHRPTPPDSGSIPVHLRQQRSPRPGVWSLRHLTGGKPSQPLANWGTRSRVQIAGSARFGSVFVPSRAHIYCRNGLGLGSDSAGATAAVRGNRYEQATRQYGNRASHQRSLAVRTGCGHGCGHIDT